MFSKIILFLCVLAGVSCDPQAPDDMESLLKLYSTQVPVTKGLNSSSEHVENTEPIGTKNSDDLTGEELDAIFEEIFRNATTETVQETSEATTESESDTTPEDDVLYEQIFEPTTTTKRPPVSDSDPQPCTFSEGQAGVCVHWSVCGKNNTVIVDGKDIGDIRASVADSCTRAHEECCLLRDENGNPITDKPKPKADGCGWRNPDGAADYTEGYEDGKTKFGEFPWMCAIIKIQMLPDEWSGQLAIRDFYVGGGSLIHPSVVLTAAHIVASASRVRVRAGVWDAHRPNSAPIPGQLREVSAIDLHQEFNTGFMYYDVALLFLSAPMVPAINVGVVCLPPPRELLPPGTRCFATGWGKNGTLGRYQAVLKKIEVPVIGRATCQKQLRNTPLGRHFQLHSSFMCAGGEEGSDTCKGDGGSPLSCPIEAEEGRYMQSGIVAWGMKCGEPDVPGVYADVSSMRAWIDERVTRRGFDPKVYSI